MFDRVCDYLGWEVTVFATLSVGAQGYGGFSYHTVSRMSASSPCPMLITSRPVQSSVFYSDLHSNWFTGTESVEFNECVELNARSPSSETWNLAQMLEELIN